MSGTLDRRIGILVTVIILASFLSTPNRTNSSDASTSRSGKQFSLTNPEEGPHCSSSLCRPVAEPIPGCSATEGCGPLAYHGGPVMHNPRNYLVFWLPPGLHYDRTNSSQSDERFELIVTNYFKDICLPNTLYEILQQYNNSGTCSFGGSIVEKSPYPLGTSRTKPIPDETIQTQIARTMFNQSWTSNSGNNEFFVFLASQIKSEFIQRLIVCGYHDFFGGTQLTIFSVITSDVPGCSSNGPNGGPVDSAISIASHEQFESVTDPLLTGWYQGNLNEIGDECSSVFRGGVATFAIGPDHFRVQSEWDNRLNGCSYGTPKMTPFTQAVNGCSGSVDISTQISPEGYPSLSLSLHTKQTSLAYSFSNSTGTPPFSSTLHLTIPAVTTGEVDYPLNITASFGGIQVVSSPLLLKAHSCNPQPTTRNPSTANNQSGFWEATKALTSLPYAGGIALGLTGLFIGAILSARRRRTRLHNPPTGLAFLHLRG